jgi:hypothetical protein
MELQILAVLPIPHCQTFQACFAIMVKTDARLLRLAFRRHSQTLFFPKHSGHSRTPVYFVLVMKLSRTSCCQTDSPISVSHYWFPCSKKETRATDNSRPLTHLYCFSVARDVSTRNLLTSVFFMALPHRIQPEVQYTQSKHKFVSQN